MPPLPRHAPLLILGAILIAAFGARVAGVAWDGYAALHPDERHLFMVTGQMFAALADPAFAGLSWVEWWFSPASPLNPHAGDKSYVYGEAPLLAGAMLGWVLGASDWFGFMPVARGLSAAVDTLTVLAVYLGARQVAGMRGALAAAVLYAAMPTALQLAHFHTVDVWLSMACAAALVPMLAMARGERVLALAAGAGALVGLAMASKITGVLMLVPLAGALGLALRAGVPARRVAGAAGLALVAVALVFRVLNPFAFDGFGLSADYLADFRGLAEVTASPHFPPNWQWIAGYGPARLLRDLALFGMGPVAFALMAGLRGPMRNPAVWLALVTVAVFVVMTALSSVSALRYAAPALPALAVALAPLLGGMRARVALPVLALALWWGAGTVRLFDGAHPRLLASAWLWTLPRGTVLTNETGWDDTLPTILRLEGDTAHRWPTHDDWFVLQRLDITDPDTPEKAERMAAMLARTDYLIVSSDRQSAVMPRLPQRFPMTTTHYEALESGQACFALVHEQDRGYPLPLLPFDDSWAQEPWRVYDHPVVRIYRREACFDADRYAALLRAGMEQRRDLTRR